MKNTTLQPHYVLSWSPKMPSSQINHTPGYPCPRTPSMWIWAVLGSPIKHSKGTLYDFRSWVIRNFAACLMLLESFIWEKSAVMSNLNTLDLHAVRKLQLTMWRSCMDRERRPDIPSYSRHPSWGARWWAKMPSWTFNSVKPSCDQPSDYTAWETPSKNHPDDFTKLNYKR